MNPASARVCKNCGAPLAPTADMPKSPAQPDPAKARSPVGCIGIAIGIAVVAMLALGLFFWWGKSQSKTMDAVAVSPHWTTSVTVQGLVPAEYAAWADEVPDDGEVVSCRQEVRDVVDQPAPNAREVCGTPYIIDDGTGYGEVMQECRYEVLDDLCQYRVLEWRVVDTLVREGSSMAVQWPEPESRGDVREAGREAKYACVLRAGDEEYSYQVENLDALAACQPGSRWQVVIDGFGALTNAEEAP
jgi:hypothetical protein